MSGKRELDDSVLIIVKLPEKNNLGQNLRESKDSVGVKTVILGKTSLQALNLIFLKIVILQMEILVL